jgi:hypothetical protein
VWLGFYGAHIISFLFSCLGIDQPSFFPLWFQPLNLEKLDGGLLNS